MEMITAIIDKPIKAMPEPIEKNPVGIYEVANPKAEAIISPTPPTPMAMLTAQKVTIIPPMAANKPARTLKPLIRIGNQNGNKTMSKTITKAVFSELRFSL